MLSALEHLCQQQKIPYERASNGVVVEFSAIYPECYHSIFLEEMSHKVVGLVRFSPCEKKEIVEADKLCFTLNGMLQSDNRLLYDRESARFSLVGPIDQEEIENSVTTIALDCDLLLPLLKRVGDIGTWDYDLVGLAFVPPCEMLHHA